MITIYGKTNCPNCFKAKNLLDNKHIPYTYINIDENKEKYEWIISQGHKQVPQIYDGDTYIGTYQGLVEYVLQNIGSLRN